MITRQPLRAPGTRLSRRGARSQRFETIVAGFAMLAQRRARRSRQIVLIDRQRTAAEAGLRVLDGRMALLQLRLSQADPGWRAETPEPEPAPAPLPPARPATQPAGERTSRPTRSFLPPPAPPAAPPAPVPLRHRTTAAAPAMRAAQRGRPRRGLPLEY